MTAKAPKRGAVLSYVTSIIAMTLGIVVLPVVTAPVASAFDGNSPIGSVDVASSPSPGVLHVGGWAFDPNSSSTPEEIYIYVNLGEGYPTHTGNARPDVQAAYHNYVVLNSGFDLVIPVPAGTDRVTIYAINTGPGNNTALWDGYVDVSSPNPMGSMDLAISPAPGQIRVAGWAFDADVPTAHIGIHVYITGTTPGTTETNGYPFTTGLSRPDVKAAYPQTISTTGFDITVPAQASLDHVVVYAINEGLGSHTILWDGFINVMTQSPIGALDAIGSVSGGSVRVAGWAFDPTSPLTHIVVHIYAANFETTIATAIPTGGYRPDVQAAYPQTSAYQGFIATVPAPTGLVNVCAYGINVGPGDNSMLGCIGLNIP